MEFFIQILEVARPMSEVPNVFRELVRSHPKIGEKILWGNPKIKETLPGYF
jgi:hypothetical protein